MKNIMITEYEKGQLDLIEEIKVRCGVIADTASEEEIIAEVFRMLMTLEPVNVEEHEHQTKKVKQN